MLDTLHEQGLLSSIDCHLARMLGQRFGAGEDEQLLAALVSHSSQAGHSCLELGHFAQMDAGQEYAPVLARLGEASQPWQAVGGPGEYLPIIHDQGRYFLHRFWQYEQTIASFLQQRVAQDTLGVDAEQVRAGLNHYFPGDTGEIDWQKVAAALAVLRPLTIISGGPGTGKTSTVAKVLAIIFSLTASPPRVAIAAPTGKAAMRLQESLQAARERLGVADIPTEASTIHRLLGVIPGSSTFRHHRGNPLAAEVIIIDEVSMIDVGLMAKLFAAIPAQARLILLGDKDQLASVKPGAVFADLCGAGTVVAFSSAMALRLADVCGTEIPLAEKSAGPLTDSLVELQRSYRYPATSLLGQVAPLINKGEGKAAMGLMAGDGDVRLCPLAQVEDELSVLVLRWYGAYLREDDLPAIFTSLERFRILSATRQGRLGVARLNLFVERLLHTHGLLAQHEGQYHGRPIMVQRNDYALGLFNGDIGVVRQQEDGILMAVFPDGQGGFRSMPPARLPQHETVFAMTIHKSQGSEFDHLAMILPDSGTQDFLTRELFYTGLTRARHSVTIFSKPSTLLSSVDKQVERMSGLGDKLI